MCRHGPGNDVLRANAVWIVALAGLGEFEKEKPSAAKNDRAAPIALEAQW
jgi:hypothetical protein